jgi:predicted DNA-binding transcriptional regulator AlpA
MRQVMVSSRGALIVGLSLVVLLGAGTAAILDDWSVMAATCAALAAVQAILLLILGTELISRPRRATGPVAARADSVESFGQDLKNRLLDGRYRTVKSFASNPRLTGVSRSTVYAAVGGVRLPTEPTIRKLLGSVVGADESETTPWLARRTELEQTCATDLADEPGPRSAKARGAVLGIGGLVLVFGVLATVSALTRAPAGAPQAGAATPATSGPPCRPLADLRAHSVPARIANTDGQGVYARIEPQEDCHTAFLPERTDVMVVCQDLHGPVITDLYAGTVRNWAVWDKLASGAYVADLYVDLPKGAQPALVDQLPAC